MGNRPKEDHYHGFLQLNSEYSLYSEEYVLIEFHAPVNQYGEELQG